MLVLLLTLVVYRSLPLIMVYIYMYKFIYVKLTTTTAAPHITYYFPETLPPPPGHLQIPENDIATYYFLSLCTSSMAPQAAKCKKHPGGKEQTLFIFQAYSVSKLHIDVLKIRGLRSATRSALCVNSWRKRRSRSILGDSS